MLRPAPRLNRLALALTALAPVTLAGDPWRGGWLLLVALAVLVALADLLVLALTPIPSLRREAAGAVPLDRDVASTLLLANPGALPVRVEIFDGIPPVATSTQLPVRARLAPRSETRLDYRLRFTQRGDFRYGCAHLRRAGPLQLFVQDTLAGEQAAVRVYPDFATVAEYALLATDHRLSQLGIRRKRRRGDGLEFHQLREYRPGDALRQIDWKATARLQKPVSRDYQDERDQRVLFLLDGGFRMRARDGDISHYDAALNTLLLLSWVVLHQGDAAGCLTFAGEQRWVAPAKGRDHLNRLMNQVFDLDAGGATPDFRALAAEVAQRCRKRSLVVLITNVRDEDCQDLLACARTLGERHLVVVATLREAAIDDLRDQPANSESLAVIAAAHHYAAERANALAALAARGVHTIDCTPAELPARLVNAYLDIKRSGRL